MIETWSWSETVTENLTFLLRPQIDLCEKELRPYFKRERRGDYDILERMKVNPMALRSRRREQKT